jgi:hypothetical protein
MKMPMPLVTRTEQCNIVTLRLSEIWDPVIKEMSNNAKKITFKRDTFVRVKRPSDVALLAKAASTISTMTGVSFLSWKMIIRQMIHSQFSIKNINILKINNYY